MKHMANPIFAVIGGTGVYRMQGLADVIQKDIETPYGRTSDPITIGTIHGVCCAFLSRHGVGHKLLPSEIPYKANIWALKSLGVKYLLCVSACGSLREDYRPLDFVLIDQFIDRTKMGVSASILTSNDSPRVDGKRPVPYASQREGTFCGGGFVCHVSFGEPTCPKLGQLVQQGITAALPAVKLHPKGTYLCMEGPVFSTRAESLMYRKLGSDVIGMTALTEAKLAREAEMAYSCVGLVTDYDAWREHEESVTSMSVLDILKKNGDNVQIFISEVIRQFSQLQPPFESAAHTALKYSMVTDLTKLSEKKKKELAPILAPYLS